jgi:hypothetical protein
MRNKMQLAWRATCLAFAVLGVIESAALIYAAPWFVIFVVLGWYAAYDFLSRKSSRSGVIGFTKDVRARRQVATEVITGSSVAPEGKRWYENPKLQALMDLGLTSDDARVEIARQLRYGGENELA